MAPAPTSHPLAALPVAVPGPPRRLPPDALQPPPRGLRLLPAPNSEPLYDDERPGGRPLPLRAIGTGDLRLVPPLVEPVPEAADPSPPASRAFAQALVQRLLEVLAGLRPVTQLRADTTDAVYEQLEQALKSRARPTGVRPGARSIRSLHIQEQHNGVAEVTATVRRGDRYLAVALRLEGSDGRWRCTHLLGA